MRTVRVHIRIVDSGPRFARGVLWCMFMQLNFIIHRMLSVVADSAYWFMSFDIISSAAAVLLDDTCGIFFCHLTLLHDGALAGG